MPDIGIEPTLTDFRARLFASVGSPNKSTNGFSALGKRTAVWSPDLFTSATELGTTPPCAAAAREEERLPEYMMVLGGLGVLMRSVLDADVAILGLEEEGG